MFSNLWRDGIFYSPDDDTGGGDEKTKEGDDKSKGKEADEKEPLDYTAWHGEQSEEVQSLISEQQKGLKSALKTERDARSDAETDLKAVAAKLEKGSEAQKEVLRLADEIAAGTQKSDFYEDAHKAGISNLKLAHHVAVEDELFDKRGNVNFEKMKEDYPELFGVKKKIQGDAGAGTGGKIGGKVKDMNVAIRTAAGKQ